MRLDVPLIRQPKGSLECGIAGLAMLLEFYGIKKSFSELKKDIVVHDIGTYSPELGIYLLKHGFDVAIITMHPKLFTKKDGKLSQEKILLRFEKMYLESKSEQNKRTLKYFMNFIRAGGRVIVKVPTAKDIEAEIKGKRPICALITSNFLCGKKPGFNFHFNVITGIDDKFVYVNDPVWDERGGKKKHAVDDFIYALYASAFPDLDNASLMTVKKKCNREQN